MTCAGSLRTIRFAWLPLLAWTACSDRNPLPLRADAGRDTAIADVAREHVGGSGGTTGSDGAPWTDGASPTGDVVGPDGAAGAGEKADVDAGLALDSGADAPPDLVVVGDGGGSLIDSPMDAGTGDLSVTEAGSACSLLEPLAGRLTERRTRKVLFTKDQSAVVLLTVNEAEGDEVLVVSLPDGKQSPVATGVADMEWLGGDEASLLLATRDGNLVVAPTDDRASRQIANGVCAHAASPDGLVVYALRDCHDGLAAVDVIDTATGNTKRFAQNAIDVGKEAASIVVSPSGSWAAFRMAGQSDGGAQASATLALVGRDGATYALLSVPGATDPKFVSDSVLVFAVGADEIRGHIPGSGDKSYIIGKGYDYGPAFGYRISPDGKILLAGRRTADASGRSMELHALNIDGSGGSRVADDLYDDLADSIQWPAFGRHYLFGFNFDGSRILYIAPVESAALTFMGGYATVMAVDVHDGTAITFSTKNAFVASPFGNDVAALLFPTIVELSTAVIVFYDLDAPAEPRAAYNSGDRSFISDVAFTADRRGFLITDRRSVEPMTETRLWYVSQNNRQRVDLGSWQSTYLPVQDKYNYDLDPRRPYPVDPTSCFVILDTDLAPGPGTLLKLLPR